MKVEKLPKPVVVSCLTCGSRYASFYGAEIDTECDECTIARQITEGITDPNNAEQMHPFVVIDGEVLRLAKQ